MRCVARREPNLQLPELPPGVTEATITHAGRTSVVHTRKPWTEVMEACAQRFTHDKRIGGPAVPAKALVPTPKRQAKPAPRPLPYRDE